MTMRQEIHGYIDAISESKLLALKPLLFNLANESAVLEWDLTDEERALIRQGMTEYEENPSSYIPLDKLNYNAV
ncbi:MAG: hypothetical protein FWG87_02730 [Defluviitaleaceae bacterium]|nr:hypothetical protein [Defluviitaleaceae bacterium]